MEKSFSQSSVFYVSVSTSSTWVSRPLPAEVTVIILSSFTHLGLSLLFLIWQVEKKEGRWDSLKQTARFMCLLVVVTTGSAGNKPTVLRYILSNFDKFKCDSDYGVKMRKRKLWAFRKFKWPAFEVGWPAE